MLGGGGTKSMAIFWGKDVHGLNQLSTMPERRATLALIYSCREPSPDRSSVATEMQKVCCESHEFLLSVLLYDMCSVYRRECIAWLKPLLRGEQSAFGQLKSCNLDRSAVWSHLQQNENAMPQNFFCVPNEKSTPLPALNSLIYSSGIKPHFSTPWCPKFSFKREFFW
jgi:hypothetical protein